MLFAPTSITLPLEDPILKFMLILVIILSAPLLLNKLRIPYLLGLIIAGAVWASLSTDGRLGHLLVHMQLETRAPGVGGTS